MLVYINVFFLRILNKGRILLIDVVFGVCIVALVFAGILARDVLSKDQGSEKMQEVSNAIREGANAFFKRQYKTIGILFLALTVLIFVGYSMLGKQELGTLTAVSFIFGAISSSLAGFIGMWIAIRANIRTASGAKRSMNDALTIAFRGGAVSGILIITMSILGIVILYSCSTSN